MKISHILTPAILSLFIFEGCISSRFYNTETPILMDINDDNRMAMAANIEISAKTKRYEAQAAYNVSGRMYVAGGLMHHQSVGDVLPDPFFSVLPSITADYRSRTNYGHGAVGYYWPVELSQGVSAIHLLAGIGIGGTKLHYTYNYPALSVPSPMPTFATVRNYDMSWQYSRLYLQGHYIVTGKSLRSTLGLRISRLQYFNGQIDSKIDTYEFYLIQKLDEKSPYALVEVPWEIGFHNNGRFFIGVGIINNVRTGGLPKMTNSMYIRSELALGKRLKK